MPNQFTTDFVPIDPIVLFWRHVDPCRTDGCMIWLGASTPTGYGVFKPSKAKAAGAHRWLYKQEIGPIPEGMELDHVKERGCMSRACVNVWEHLEPVTHGDNLRRGLRHGPNVWSEKRRLAQPAKTHCPKGHPYDEENTRWYLGKRYCRECRRVQNLRRIRKH